MGLQARSTSSSVSSARSSYYCALDNTRLAQRYFPCG